MMSHKVVVFFSTFFVCFSIFLRNSNNCGLSMYPTMKKIWQLDCQSLTAVTKGPQVREGFCHVENQPPVMPISAE